MPLKHGISAKPSKRAIWGCQEAARYAQKLGCVDRCVLVSFAERWRGKKAAANVNEVKKARFRLCKSSGLQIAVPPRSWLDLSLRVAGSSAGVNARIIGLMWKGARLAIDPAAFLFLGELQDHEKLLEELRNRSGSPWQPQIHFREYIHWKIRMSLECSKTRCDYIFNCTGNQHTSHDLDRACPDKSNQIYIQPWSIPRFQTRSILEFVTDRLNHH